MLQAILEGSSPILALAIALASWLLLLALGLCFYRIARGPTLADRVVALDVLNILAVAYCALLAISSGRDVYLDAAIALALVAFLVTVAFGRFVERLAEEEVLAKTEGEGTDDSSHS
ncbi:multiple resistance and pH regulation protein F [Microbulbifer agarilyticus]|uniref:Multiple resistance and pH regulation protein F n=2 Tax=Microbulbifer agarilyticus TaxID=260552 RepID=A0A1Q2M1M6_9GAMM|nr:multiple resistance and pH regulation protein F [Microbulbifer agarilyticus]